MRVRLGPILYARPSNSTNWRFDIGLLIEDAPAKGSPFTVTSDTDVVVGPAQTAAHFSDVTLFVWPITVSRTDNERRISYTLSRAPGYEGEGLDETLVVDNVVIPASRTLPRLAFFSCNGFSTLKAMQRVEVPNAMWRRLLDQHLGRGEPDDPKGYHILIGGGDQVYCDSIWYDKNRLQKLYEGSRKKKLDAQAGQDFPASLLDKYVDVYASRWGRARNKDVADTLARIPTFFTWDDHDIFDGWGSYDDKLQACPLFQTFYTAARICFEALQLGGVKSPLLVNAPSHYLQKLTFEAESGRLDLIALDLRSGRTQDQVMSDAQWSDLKSVLDTYRAEADPDQKKHVLLLSSIPLVYMRFNFVEKLLGWWPGAQEIEDDLRDQWESDAHRTERKRLLLNLLPLAKAPRSRVTILSGDVHVAARGRITSTRPVDLAAAHNTTVIEQVTSSAIVHPSPSGIEMAALQLLGAESTQQLDAGVTTELITVQRGSPYLPERNYLSICADEGANAARARLWIKWHAERTAVKDQVVVEP